MVMRQVCVGGDKARSVVKVIIRCDDDGGDVNTGGACVVLEELMKHAGVRVGW